LAAFVAFPGAGASVKIPPLTNPLLRGVMYTSKGDAIVSVKPVTKDDAAVVPIAPLTLVFSP
jgi:hypothetical protein